MPKKPVTQDGPDLFDILDEIENGPLPCPHRYGVRMETGGWSHETDPHSPYFEEWVHGDPNCRRSAFPGEKQPL